MSKGSPMHGVRVAPAVDAEMGREIEKRNDHTREEPYGPAGFIAAAIREKIAKKKRGRNKAARRAARLAEILQIPIVQDVAWMLS